MITKSLFFVYNLILIFGTSYVVFGLDRSPWWWVLTLALRLEWPECEVCAKRKKGA